MLFLKNYVKNYETQVKVDKQPDKNLMKKNVNLQENTVTAQPVGKQTQANVKLNIKTSILPQPNLNLEKKNQNLDIAGLGKISKQDVLENKSQQSLSESESVESGIDLNLSQTNLGITGDTNKVIYQPSTQAKAVYKRKFKLFDNDLETEFEQSLESQGLGSDYFGEAIYDWYNFEKLK